MWSIRTVITSDNESSASCDAVVVRASAVRIANEQLTVTLFADLTFPFRTRVAVGCGVERQVAHNEAVSDTCQSTIDVVNYRLAITVVIAEPALT